MSLCDNTAVINFFRTKDSQVPAPDQALPGRDETIPVPDRHIVLGSPLVPPFPEGVEYIEFGMGCFWGAERLFWQLPGVYSTAVGYAGGSTPNPTYREVCSGRTGHAEVVLVAYRPSELPLAQLLRTFWEEHDPTQGMRQGNDVGTQYRSAIYYHTPEQGEIVRASRDAYAAALAERHRGPITTEIAEAGPFYPAEEYHQQYLEKNPGGYCGLAGTGVSCPIGLGVSAVPSSN
jgi:peptide-methionine (S)-S-oxide reductase